MNQQADEFDMVIVGGGMVGASLALALASLEQRIAIVEAHPPGTPGQPSYDDRATALSNGSRRVFEMLGVWPGLAALATPIRQIHVSDRGHFGMTRIAAADEGVEALGYLVRNRHIGRALMQAVAQCPGISLISPARVTDIESRPAGVSVKIDTPNSGADTGRLSCSLLIAADGAGSSVRKLLAIDATNKSYEQVAVIANISTEKEHDNIAYERFTEDGPLAVLPMSAEDAPGSAGGRATIVWTIAAEHADAILALDDQAFAAAFQERFGFRLGRILRAGKRNSYPLALIRSEEQVRDRIVIVGNAAHSLHPVAGQGFNLSLRDTAALAEVIADAQAAGEDFGSRDVLQRYADWRKRDQEDVIRFSDGLIGLFGSRRPVVRLGRNLGLIGMELVPGAKRLMARQTMGVAGRLPRLARGLPLK